MELASSPILLTLISCLHAWQGGTLPNKRELLYHEAVELLQDQWEQRKLKHNEDGTIQVSEPSLVEYLRVDRSDFRSALNELAYDAHLRQAGLEGTAEIQENDLVCLLMKIPVEDQGPRPNPVQLSEYLNHRTGLLLATGNGVFSFPHRTFQEYLSACWLTDKEDYPDCLSDLVGSEPDRWREVALLAAAKAFRGMGKASLGLLVDSLCPEDGGDTDNVSGNWTAYVAGLALVELLPPEKTGPVLQRKLKRVTGRFTELLKSPEFPVNERAHAGRVLGQWGDPRPEVTDPDAMQFCWVPGGDFFMGAGEVDKAQLDKHGKPQHLNPHLKDDYWMGRFPVTVAQFKVFSDSTDTVSIDALSLQDPLNCPVRNVTWYQAREFCRWLTQRWTENKLIPEGWSVRLPTEAEWEKAARGGVSIPKKPDIQSIGQTNGPVECPLIENPYPKRSFPWEDSGEDTNNANFKGTGIGETSAVGCFAGGRSPYGCEDMCGNVWEWTATLWGKNLGTPEFSYPYDPGDGRENQKAGNEVLRVLRGGGFRDDRFIRVGSRDGSDPLGRWGSLGFRVILSPFSLDSETLKL